MDRVSKCAIVTAVLMIAGCAQARYVERQSDSGVVAIPANTNHWPTYYRQAAIDLITQHVGPHFEIVDEREVVVGQTTDNTQQINDTFTFGTMTTRQLTEWRIAYRRAAAPAMMPVGMRPPHSGMPGNGTTRPAGGVGQPASGVSGPSGVQPASGTLPPGTTSGQVIPSVAPPQAPAAPGSGFGSHR